MIRGLAISGVDSSEKYIIVINTCERISTTHSDVEYMFDGAINKELGYVFDEGTNNVMMHNWLDNISEDDYNYVEWVKSLKNCRKLTYNQFLLEFVNKPIDIERIYDEIQI